MVVFSPSVVVYCAPVVRRQPVRAKTYGRRPTSGEDYTHGQDQDRGRRTLETPGSRPNRYRWRMAREEWEKAAEGKITVTIQGLRPMGNNDLNAPAAQKRIPLHPRVPPGHPGGRPSASTPNQAARALLYQNRLYPLPGPPSSGCQYMAVMGGDGRGVE